MFAAVLAVASCATGYDPVKGGPPDIGDQWYITFESEFDRPSQLRRKSQIPIDAFDALAPRSDDAKWEYRDGPNKAAYAVGANAFIEDSETLGRPVLVLRTSIDSDPDQQRSNAIRTGYIRTRNYEKTRANEDPTFTQKFGYFEARMKFDSSPGQWGAFWLMPEHKIWCADGSGRDATEIDIVEGFPAPAGRSRNRHKSVNLAIHYDGYGRFHRKQDLAYPGTAETPFARNFDASKFHNYGLLWTPDSYTWYVDGRPVAHIDDPDLISQSEKYLKLSTEAANWAGKIDPQRLPADTEVDWVKVWQSKKMVRGNPLVFEVEDAGVTLNETTQIEHLETGTWCFNKVARAAPDTVGRLSISIDQPVRSEQIGIRVSNTVSDQSWVKLLVDGEVMQSWEAIDLDTLFILKHDRSVEVSKSIEIVWSDPVVIDQVYLIPRTPTYSALDRNS